VLGLCKVCQSWYLKCRLEPGLYKVCQSWYLKCRLEPGLYKVCQSWYLKCRLEPGLYIVCQSWYLKCRLEPCRLCSSHWSELVFEVQVGALQALLQPLVRVGIWSAGWSPAGFAPAIGPLAHSGPQWTSSSSLPPHLKRRCVQGTQA